MNQVTVDMEDSIAVAKIPFERSALQVGTVDSQLPCLQLDAVDLKILLKLLETPVVTGPREAMIPQATSDGLGGLAAWAKAALDHLVAVGKGP